MIRFLTIIFYGSLFWLGFDFLFESGLYYNYIKANHIDVFFNAFFVHSQNWWLWPAGISVFGYLFLTERLANTWKLVLFSLIFLAGVSPWYPPIGRTLGEKLFAKPHMGYRFGKIVIENVTLLYRADGTDYIRLPNGKVVKFPASSSI